VTQAWSTDVLGLGGPGGMRCNRVGFADINQIRTGGEATDYVSDTSVRCQVGQGVQGSRQAQVIAKGWSGSVTQAWSTDLPGFIGIAASIGKIFYNVWARKEHMSCGAMEVGFKLQTSVMGHNSRGT